MVVLVASPVVAAPWGFDRFQLPRLVAQAIAVVVALAAALRAGSLRVHRVLVPVAVLLGVLVAAALASGAVEASLVGTSSRRFGVLGWLLLAGGFVVGLCQATEEGRARVVRALLGASAVVAGVAVLQRVGNDALGLGSEGTGARPASTLGSATSTGAVLAVAAVIAVATWARGEERWTWVAPIAVLDLVALVLTRSRGAWLGAAAALVWLVVGACRTMGWQAVWRRWRVGAGVCLVAIVTTGVVDPGIVSRVSSFAEPGSGTAGGRIELLGMGLDAFTERPVLGWGPDRSRPALHASIPDGFEARFDDVRLEDRAHDVVVDVAVWAGVPGVLALGWLLLAFGRSAWRQRLVGRCGAIGLGVAAFGVHLLVNFPVPDVDVVMWCLAGSVLPAVARPSWRAPAFVVVPAALGALAVVLVPAVDALVADHHLRVGVDRENALDPSGAREAYAAAVRADPGSALTREIDARYLLRAGDPAGAEVQARAALSAEPGDPYLAELLATIRTSRAIAESDTALAATVADEWRVLIDESPYDASLHLGLGNALAAAGDTAGARAEYARCLELHPGDADAMANFALLG